jgi:hypothetical protein
LEVLAIDKSDAGHIGDKLVVPEARTIVQQIQNFLQTYRERLPPKGVECLERRLASADGYTKGEGYWGVQQAITFLVMLRAEFDYAIADHSAVARSLTERAFSHLRRSLIADEALREQWKAAFGEREENCERLGAVHLLSHGIWAFKANATDSAGRTDLVLGTPMSSTDEAERAAEALVLTEWKKVQAQEDSEKKADEAQAQAELYAGGILGAFELADVRYLVLVSKDVLRAVENRRKGEVTYRVVNIPIDPSTPSKLSRRREGGK